MIPRLLFCAFLSFLIAVGGCAKKKSAVDQKNSPNVATVADTSAKKSTDIFDEFYDEGSGAASKTAKAEKALPATKAASKKSSSMAAVSSSDFVEGGRYIVQVSCVRSQALAEKLVSQFKEKGYPAYFSEVQNPTPNLSGTYYRVRIGAFSGISGAKAFAENTLAPAGFEFWVDKKSNDNVGIEGYGLGSGSTTPSSYSGSSSSSTESSSGSTSGSSWGSSSSTTTGSGTGSGWGSSTTTETSTSAPAATSTPAVEPAAPASSAPVSEPAAATPAASPSTSTSSSTPSSGDWAPTPSTSTAPASTGSDSSAKAGKSGDDWGGDDWGK